MEILHSVALANCIAWASGMRLNAVFFSAGMLGRLGYFQRPSALHILKKPWMLGLSGSLLLIEFLADKIPVLDSLWGSVQTFLSMPAGALLAALSMGEHYSVLTLTAGSLSILR